MEFFVQELTLAALFTAVLYWVLAISYPFNRPSSLAAFSGESIAKDEIFSTSLEATAAKGKEKAVISNADRRDSESAAAPLGDCVVGSAADGAEIDGGHGPITSEEKGFSDEADDRLSEKIEMASTIDGGGNNLDGALCNNNDENPLEVIGLKESEFPASEENDNSMMLGPRKSSEEDIEDDWEGIERNELERKFALAVNYVEYGRNRKGRGEESSKKLGFEDQMKLYGLRRLAIEGPCFESQPMALKFSARAKWSAWQRLGKLSPEEAMEQYITLLDDYDPQWMKGDSLGRD